MGRGGEKSLDESSIAAPGLLRRPSFGSLTSLKGLADDLSTLRHLWFSQLQGSKSKDHATRLEQFYGPQAAACEAGSGAAPGASQRRARLAPTTRGRCRG